MSLYKKKYRFFCIHLHRKIANRLHQRKYDDNIFLRKNVNPSVSIYELAFLNIV